VFGKKAWQVDYSNVPTAIFSSPEIGTIGLNELEARAQYPAVNVYKDRFRPRTWRTASSSGWSIDVGRSRCDLRIKRKA
jgi:pyruvate/2-oxoglutarate dehydrogenase complex dihydrolipoamide dehydrogenase (E3) component